jgi:arylformamidase
VKRIAAGGSSNVSKLVMGTHTGTHVDAPKHFFDDGAVSTRLPLDLLIGPRARGRDHKTRGDWAKKSSRPPACEKTFACC